MGRAMRDQDKSKAQLISELEDLRRRAAEQKRADESLQECDERCRNALEELRHSQATLDAFFSASPVILNICDEDFRYIKTSGPLPDYFGLDSRSIVGKSLKELDLEYFKEYGRMLERVIETGEPVHNVEMKSRAPSRGGEMVYWRASHFPLSLPNGRRGAARSPSRSPI